MAFEPYPSKSNDPAWTDFTAAHSDPLRADPQTGRPAPVLPEIDVAAMVRLVEQTQHVQSAIVHPGKSKVPVWARGEHAKTAAWSVVVPTLVTGCANVAVHQWGVLGPTVTGGLVAFVAALASFHGQDKHWSGTGAALTMGIGIGALDFAMTAGGTGWTDVLAWMIGAGSVIGYKIIWNRKHAESRAKVALTEAKVRTENFKGDAVKSGSAIKDAINLLKLQEAQRVAAEAAAAVTLRVAGATPEEQALRRAVWDVFNVELFSCNVQYTRTGYIATVGLPVALARDTARSGWDKVSSALRADGRFVVTNGRLSNELDVKFLDRAKTDTSPILWTPDRMPDAVRNPLYLPGGDKPVDPAFYASLGMNTETGDPVLVQFDERLLVCGASGTGKSWATRPLLAHAHTHGDLILLDGKGEEGNVWGDVCRVGQEDDEIEDLIDVVYDEMNRRKGILKSRGKSVWDHNDGRQITFFVDEGQVILSLVGRNADRMQRLRALTSLGRSRGIVVWWATQKPTMSGNAPGIDSQMAGNLLQRFSLRVATEQEARTALDDCAHYGPQAIPEDRAMRGHGYLKGYGPSLVRSWTMDDAAVRRLPVSVWQGGSEASPAEQAMAYMAANPGSSTRATAAALGIPESTLRKSLKGA